MPQEKAEAGKQSRTFALVELLSQPFVVPPRSPKRRSLEKRAACRSVVHAPRACRRKVLRFAKWSAIFCRFRHRQRSCCTCRAPTCFFTVFGLVFGCWAWCDAGQVPSDRRSWRNMAWFFIFRTILTVLAAVQLSASSPAAPEEMVELQVRPTSPKS